MKILVIGDLHGRKPRIHFKDFDCIIQVGDICSDKEIAPYYKKLFRELKKNPEISLNIEKMIIQDVGKKEFKQMEKRSLEGGRKILEFLNSFDKPVFIVPGNWDESYGKTKIKNMDGRGYSRMKAFYDMWGGSEMNKKLVRGLKNIRDCQFRLHRFCEVNILGYGLSSCPEKVSRKNFNEKDYLKLKRAYEKLIGRLKDVYGKRDKKFPTIFLTHNIPYSTKLDVGKQKGSYAYKKHLGSTIAKDFCVKSKPLLCIGGHMHEGRGKDKIGKTVVINPGFGRDAQVLVEIVNKKVKKVEFWKR
ncbi:metallophosphoesterase [Candidatus Pacearchaeota archaeon]|nr:metallophosphoesterase [Candidatus Pacearchaeota archaeon]